MDIRGVLSVRSESGYITITVDGQAKTIKQRGCKHFSVQVYEKRSDPKNLVSFSNGHEKITMNLQDIASSGIIAGDFQVAYMQLTFTYGRLGYLNSRMYEDTKVINFLYPLVPGSEEMPAVSFEYPKTSHLMKMERIERIKHLRSLVNDVVQHDERKIKVEPEFLVLDPIFFAKVNEEDILTAMKKFRVYPTKSMQLGSDVV